MFEYCFVELHSKYAAQRATCCILTQACRAMCFKRVHLCFFHFLSEALSQTVTHIHKQQTSQPSDTPVFYTSFVKRHNLQVTFSTAHYWLVCWPPWWLRVSYVYQLHVNTSGLNVLQIQRLSSKRWNGNGWDRCSFHGCLWVTDLCVLWSGDVNFPSHRYIHMTFEY